MSDAAAKVAPEVGKRLAERYAPLSVALCGRRLQFAYAGADERTHTDGVTIFLRPSATDDERRIEMTIQCMLLAGDSLAPATVLQLVGRPLLAHRYLALEAARLLRAASLLPRLVIGARLAALPVMSNSRTESLRLMRDARIDVGDELLLGELRPTRLLRNFDAIGRGAARPEDLRKRQKRAPEDPELGDGEDAADDMPSLIDKFAMPFNVIGPLGDMFRKLLGARRAGASAAEPGMEIPTGTMKQSSRLTSRGQRAAYSLEVADASDATRLVSRWTYPEWDFTERRYRADWCVVHEIPVAWTTDRSEPVPFRRDVLLERGLRRLALGMTRERRQLDGDDLDLDAMVDLTVAIESSRHGTGGDTRMPIYSAVRRNRRELAALLLLDISGSTLERIAGGRSVQAEQLQTTAALTHALSAVGDRVATLACHSNGRDGVRAITLKNFDEHAPLASLADIQRLKSSGYTRLGAGIRHGAYRLVHDAGVNRRLLVVISDGVPYDTDYIGRYAARDVMRALDECAVQHVHVLWLCFGTMEPELKDHLENSCHEMLSADSYGALRAKLVAAMARSLIRPGRSHQQRRRGSALHSSNPSLLNLLRSDA